MAISKVFLFALISMFVLQKSLSYSSIGIEKEEISTLSNSMANGNYFTTNSGTTNSQLNTITEPELPNSYLSSGKIENIKPETVPRRMDLIYWIAMPAIYYFTITIMYTKNELVFNNINVDNADMNYVYLNTFMIPLAAAYFDYLYLDDQYRLKAKTFGHE